MVNLTIMKQITLLFVLLFALNSCTHKKIEYQELKNIQVLDINSKSVTLSADAVFKNPYILGGKVIPDDIIVYIDDKEITKVKSTEFKVPALKEFSIPLEVNIPFDKLSSSGGLLGAVLNSIGKTHQVTFKGKIYYKVAGIKSTYEINHTEKLKL